MKRLFFVVLLAAFAFSADSPKFTDTQKLRIRDAQIEVQNVQLQMDQLQAQWTQLQQQKQAAAQKLQDAIKQSFEDAKLKQDEYDLDGNLNLTAKPKPPQPGTKAGGK